jgi:hypothetical protein
VLAIPNPGPSAFAPVAVLHLEVLPIPKRIFPEEFAMEEFQVFAFFDGAFPILKDTVVEEGFLGFEASPLAFEDLILDAFHTTRIIP